ncbi:MAG: tetratricopeptide repeat protein [Candidatus Eiseniibacteriota bacterium]
MLLISSVSLVATSLLVAWPTLADERATDAGEMPITTASDEARSLYLEARGLFETLRATDSRQYAEKAVEHDPGFALAHLLLAQSAPTAAAFWESERRAVAATDGLSPAERHMILGFDAGVRGDPSTQLEHYAALVDLYPRDARALTLLGNYHFGQQHFDRAIELYERATAADPDYSQPYNQLGYARRTQGDYDAARTAFETYIRLIPDEPNPYDSYAELLMKMGEFESSIENYEKALAVNEHFAPSFVGIASNYMLMGRYEEAHATLARFLAQARTAGERRQALTWMAANHLHQGDHDGALEQVQKMYEIARATDDRPSMAGDLTFMGNLLLDRGDTSAALARFVESVEMLQSADVPDDVKANNRRNSLFNEARVALAAGDLEMARALTAAYGRAVIGLGGPFQIWQWNLLRGRIALAEDDPAAAVDLLGRANQQDPRVLLQQGIAYERLGQPDEARAHCERAARFNQVNLNYAYVKSDAEAMLAAHAGS